VLNEKGRVHLEENSYKQKLEMREGEGKKDKKKKRTRKCVRESEEKIRKEMIEVSK
jgi:hypothetical protein